MLHEQRAVRQPDLFMHSTWSLRDDYHSRHRGSSTGSHDMRRAEAARELSEAAMAGARAARCRHRRRAFELGQPGAADRAAAAPVPLTGEEESKGSFVKEQGVVPPMPPDAYVKVEIVVKEEESSGSRPKRRRTELSLWHRLCGL